MSSRTSSRHRSYSATVTYGHSKRLSLPRESARPSEWTKFATDATVLLLSGNSIATALGDDVDSAPVAPEQLAAGVLTSAEKEQYALWKKSGTVPKADWRRLRTQLSAATAPQRARWVELTEALRVLYGDGGISAENCKAWVEKYPASMPLLVASKKVETARRDAKYAKGSKAARDVREIAACRRVVRVVGGQRVRANTSMKKLNREAGEREAELVKRLNRLEMGEEARDRDGASKRFASRESYWSKLTKARVERVEMAAVTARQNAELLDVEKVLQGRIGALEERIRAEKRR